MLSLSVEQGGKKGKGVEEIFISRLAEWKWYESVSQKMKEVTFEFPD